MAVHTPNWGKSIEASRISSTRSTQNRRPRCLTRQGLLLVKKGEHQRALDDFSRSVALNPKEAEPFANRAELYLKLGQRERAIDDARTVLALPATSPLAREAQVRAAELITQLTVAQPAVGN